VPLHVTTAFNGLRFGYDLASRGPTLAVGLFVLLERGRHILRAEVAAKFDATGRVASDDWVPPDLSSAPKPGPARKQIITWTASASYSKSTRSGHPQYRRRVRGLTTPTALHRP
jgi:hypothetical protein